MPEGKEVRTVRYRVLPGTQAKARRLNCLAGACRYVWNVFLDRQQHADLAWQFSAGPRPPFPRFFTLGKAFTQLRRSSGHEWLEELPFAVVRYTLKRQADAWQKLFNGQGGRPKFKGRGCGMGFTVPENVRIRNGHVLIPKMGQFRLRRRGGNPHPDGIPKQAVFTPEGNKWFCTVFYEVSAAAHEDDGLSVGVDRNVGQCALNSGEIIHIPDMKRLEARRRRYQRRMARQMKGSRRRARTRRKHAKTCRRVRGIRSNWAHQASRRIADAAHTVAIEDLNTKGMTRSAKGAEGAPGTKVKAKSGLNRAILSSGWGDLERNLDYKAGRVVRVHPAYTSQTCSACGFVDAGNRIDQSTFRCQACGHAANADVNAAENIRRQGLAQLDGEGRGCSKARPVTRQTGGELPLAV